MRSRLPSPLRATFCAALLGAVAACNPPVSEGEGESNEGEGDVVAEGEGDANEGEGDIARACVRTAALDEVRVCADDDDCACGAHCAVGSCAFDCRADADCDDGESCDDFGRCAVAGADRVRFVAPGRARISVSSTALRVAAADVQHTVVLRGAPDGSTSTVHVVAVGGARVRCDSAAPADACDVVVGPAGATLGVIIPASAIDAARVAPAGADLFDNGVVTPVRVSIASAQTFVAPSGTPVERAVGRYSGFVRINDGVGLVGSVVGTRNVDAPVAAYVVGSGASGVIVVEDLLGFGLPKQKIVLPLDDVGGALHVRVPRLTWLRAEQAEVITDSVDVTVATAGAISIDVRLPILGLALPNGEAPALRLALNLSQVGPVGADDVTVAATADDEQQYDPGRGIERLGDGARIADIAAGLASASDKLTFDDRNVVGCADGDNALARRAPKFEASCNAALPNTLGGIRDLGITIRSMHPPAECAAAVQPDGSAAVPCHYVGRYDDTLTIVDFDENICARLAADTGCIIEDRSVGPFLPNTVVPHFATQVCVMPAFVPANEARCTAATLCSSDEGALDDNQAITAVSEASGDLLCNENVGSVTAAALELTPDSLVTFIDDCAGDLEQARSADAPVSTTTLFESRSCISTHRLFVTLDEALRHVRAGEDAPTSARVAQRQLQQLMQVQNLVAQGAVDLYREELALGQVASTSDVLARVDAALAPWSVVLDPRVAGPLLALPPATLAEPDPRPDYGLILDATTPNAPAEGLPVAMLEAMTAPLAALDLLTERAWRESNPNLITELRGRFADALKTAQIVVVVADALHARALTHSGDLAWEAGYQNARAQYALAVSRHADHLQDIDDGKNPLGLEPTDLPIYFPGEPDNDRDRFLAVSRFLTGTGPGSLTGVAPRAIADADDALEAARAAFRERTDVDVNAEERIGDITRRYGELITGFCGAPINDPGFDVDSFNVLSRPLDTETCFIEPACRARPDQFVEDVDSASLGFELCIAGRAKAAFAGAVSVDASLAPAVTVFTELLGADRTSAFPLRLVRFEHPTPNERVAIVTMGTAEVRVPLDESGHVPFEMPAVLFDTRSDAVAQAAIDNPAAAVSTPDSRARDLIDACNDRREATQAARAALNATVSPTCLTADNCGLAERCTEGRCVARGSDPLDSVDCYFDGAIAEQALAVRQAKIEVDIARAELEESTDRYDIAMRSCFIQRAGQDAVAGLERAHAKTMNDMDIGRAAAASAGEALQGAADCAGTIAGATIAVAAGVSCALAGGAAAARIAAEAVQTAMNVAERDHALVVASVENNTALAQCFNDADMELIGAKAAALRITSAQQAQAQAILNLRGQKSYTAALHVEGNIAVENERRRLARALPSRSILSDAAERYLDRFDYAQRLTFLAVRAAEYELQQELPLLLRDVMAATRPLQLEDVLRDVAALVNAGQVDGSNPTGLIAVVSLRDHLLQLRSLTDNPAGEQNLTKEERFRLLITNPRFARFDDAGRYLGQEIPFALQPLGAVGLGNSQGIGLFAQNDCAERVFAVNAAVVGDDVLTDGSTFTRLDLLQKNTFFSQKCRADDAAPFQVSTMQPSVNLLADHQDFAQRNLPSSATNDAVRGQMQPYVNVDRAEFEREEYGQGATTQLASRGLYGDYALFIPAGALSVDGSPGLRLDHVDDVLLRIDYVAVAR